MNEPKDRPPTFATCRDHDVCYVVGGSCWKCEQEHERTMTPGDWRDTLATGIGVALTFIAAGVALFLFRYGSDLIGALSKRI